MRMSETEVVSLVSRRTLIETVSAAAIASCLACSMMVTDKRRLSQTFQRNAYGFYRAAVTGQVPGRPAALYPLAIAIELSLKAYLLHRGVSDDWNRTHIRHDLGKALVCAENLGFRPGPYSLVELAASLTPCYERRAFGWRLPQLELPQPTPRARETVRSLLRGVDRQIDEETVRSAWQVRRGQEVTYA